MPRALIIEDEITARADLRAKLAAQGIEISGSSPEALKDELLEEIAKWAKVIQEGNIKAD